MFVISVEFRKLGACHMTPDPLMFEKVSEPWFRQRWMILSLSVWNHRPRWRTANGETQFNCVRRRWVGLGQRVCCVWVFVPMCLLNLFTVLQKVLLRYYIFEGMRYVWLDRKGAFCRVRYSDRLNLLVTVTLLHWWREQNLYLSQALSTGVCI